MRHSCPENQTYVAIMGKLYDLLREDYRVKEGLKTCINCGTCTAICPAAEFYRYDPRRIVDTVQRGNDEDIEALLKSDTIWYCGECLSCLTRCPRRNGPGLVIMALRDLSARLGYFVESEKGRQLYPLTKIMTGNILTLSAGKTTWNPAPSGNGTRNISKTATQGREPISAAPARESSATSRRSLLTN